MKWDKEANNALRKAIVDCAKWFDLAHDGGSCFTSADAWQEVACAMPHTPIVDGEECRIQHERLATVSHEKPVENPYNTLSQALIDRISEFVSCLNDKKQGPDKIASAVQIFTFELIVEMDARIKALELKAVLRALRDKNNSTKEENNE